MWNELLDYTCQEKVRQRTRNEIHAKTIAVKDNVRESHLCSIVQMVNMKIRLHFRFLLGSHSINILRRRATFRCGCKSDSSL